MTAEWSRTRPRRSDATRFKAPLRRGLFCSSGWRRSRHIAFMPIRLDRERRLDDSLRSGRFRRYSRSPCDHPVADLRGLRAAPEPHAGRAIEPAGASPDACRPQGADPRPRTRGLHHAGATDRRRYGFCLEQGIHIIGNFLEHNNSLPRKLEGLEDAVTNMFIDVLTTPGGRAWWAEA